MRIPICHQFWENGENARWLPQVFPVEKLESQIKADYQSLATARPAARKYGEYTVFFDYRPAKDIFGRNIVPISFAFYKNFPDDPALARHIHKALANAPNSQIWLDLPCAARAAKQGRSGKKAYAKLIILTLAVILAFGIILKLSGSRNPAPAEKILPAPAASLPAAANIPATQNSPLHKPAPPQIQSAQILPARKPPADICQTPELWQSLLKCPRAFVEKRCRGETSADFRAFRQNDVACRPAYGKAAPWSRNLPVFREGASPEGRNALENFIFGD